MNAKQILGLILACTLTACGGGGSSNSTTTPAQSASPVVKPLVTLSSSYENKAVAGQALNSQRLPSEVASGNAVAFADFLQNGTYTMVTHTLDYVPSWDQTKMGSIHFYQQVGSIWVDITPRLLTDTKGCLHPRKAVVADFNGDGKPDVFFACHGYDKDPWPGESPHILLSQSDGTYKNQTLPITGFFHSATAVDLTKNGYADLIVTDSAGPFYLKNNHDGTFTKDDRFNALKGKSIFTVEAIDVDANGTYDVIFGGSDNSVAMLSWESAPQILYMDSQMNVVKTTMITSNSQYATVLDFVINNGKLFILRTNTDSVDGSIVAYTTAAIQQVELSTMSSSIVYTHAGQYANSNLWVNWLIPTGQTVSSMDLIYNIKL